MTEKGSGTSNKTAIALSSLMSAVTIHKAKTELSKLIARVEKDKEIVILRGTQPVAKLVPVVVKRPVSEAFFEPLSDEELSLWEGPIEPSA